MSKKQSCEGCNEKGCSSCVDYNKYRDKDAIEETEEQVCGGISEKYGKYHGILTKFQLIGGEVIPENITYRDFDDTHDIIKSLFRCGCTEVCIDVEPDEEYGDTMFFETNSKTNFQQLLTILVPLRPDEFTEETPGHFRMWFD